jgi:integral membrane protein
MSSPRTTPTSPGSPPRTGGLDPRSVARRLLAYRVMAYLTGVLLLLLVSSMVLKYGFGDDTLNWSAYAHGWMYLVYLITVALLGAAVRWRPARIVLVALAGTIPLMSFVAERSVTREVRNRAA